MRSFLLSALGAALLMIAPFASNARETDSLHLFMQKLNADYAKHQISDSLYVKTIDSLVFVLFDKKEFPQHLETYRSIIFSNDRFALRRIVYFQYLGIYEVNNNSNGKAIFYFGKMAAEAEKQKNYPRAMAAHRAMISIFSSNRDYQQCFKKYALIRNDIIKQTDSIGRYRMDPLMIDGCVGILQTMVDAYYGTDSTAAAAHSFQLLEKIHKAVLKDTSAHYKMYLSRINCSYYISAFTKASKEKDNKLADTLLQQLVNQVKAPDFPAQLRPFFLHDSYEKAVEHYLDINNKDSARRYLRLYDDLTVPIGTNKRKVFYHESVGELAAEDGNYQLAYRHLDTANHVKDSVLNATLIDRDNNAYAQTESEYNRQLLSAAEQNNLATIKRNLILKVSIGVLVLVSAFAIWWIRQHQRHKFLNAKLKMARNIHDEVSPMLLYAKLLARKEKELSHSNSPNLALIETQLNNSIETVRGLSHDLKSNQEFTTSQLYLEIRELLEKTQKVTGITYNLIFNRKDKTLNYFQYQHIRNIVHELVNNTIKHSDWKLIEAVLQIIPKKLIIQYSDHGPGFAPGFEQKPGIGLENITERVQKLKGELKLNNNYPDGYSIEINIPLT